MASECWNLAGCLGFREGHYIGAIDGLAVEGGDLTIHGAQIAGDETIAVVAGSHMSVGDIDWTPATIQYSDDDKIIIVVPELGISRIDRVLVRVTTALGDEFTLGTLVRAD